MGTRWIRHFAVVAISPSILLAAPNNPPTACFTVSPATGPVTTSFAVNASCSTDDKTPLSGLKFSWDWENTGAWTAYANSPTASHVFASAGLKTIALRVKDAQNAVGTTTRTVDVIGVQEASLGEIPPNGAAEPDVAVHPINPQTLLVSANVTPAPGPGSVLYPVMRSTDGGTNWLESSGPAPVQAVDPNIEFNHLGDAFLTVMSQVNDPTPIGVRLFRSTDGGQTFPDAAYAIDEATPCLFPNGASVTACASPELPPRFDRPQLVIDRSPTSPYRGTLHVQVSARFYDPDGDGTCNSAPYVQVRSQNNWDSWTSCTALPAITLGPGNFALGADGSVHIGFPNYVLPAICPSTFGVAYQTSTDGGATFGAATCARDTGTGTLVGHVSTAAHPSDPNRVYIAYAMASAAGQASHVYVTRSLDHGSTWGAPVRVDEALPDDAVDHMFSSLSVSTTGRLDLAWADYRNSTPKIWNGLNDQRADVYYSYSLDGGATWAKSVRMSTVTAAFYRASANDFLTTTSEGNKAYVAFAQDRTLNGLFEVYLSTATFH